MAANVALPLCVGQAMSPATTKPSKKVPCMLATRGSRGYLDLRLPRTIRAQVDYSPGQGTSLQVAPEAMLWIVDLETPNHMAMVS